jgi:hypothetical protein
MLVMLVLQSIYMNQIKEMIVNIDQCGRCCCDLLVVGFPTTSTISAYHY